MSDREPGGAEERARAMQVCPDLQGKSEGHGGAREQVPRTLLVADGALGTMLHAQGLGAGEPPELWNLTRPEAVQGIHEAYLAVGCDLVATNSFGANRLRLKASGLEDQVAAINWTAVQLARRACSSGHRIAGCVGPTGCFDKGRQSGSSIEIESAFDEQVAHLVGNGVDFILIETMTHLNEARMALRAVQHCSSVPVAVSLVFFERGGRFLTLDEASPQEAARELSAAQVVGCNCMDVEGVREVLRQMRQATDLPLIAQPHAGLPGKHQAQMVYPLTPEDIARYIPSLLEFNLGIVGGCCGTTPAHLEAVVRSVPHP